MCVILGKAANSQEAVHDAGAFVAIHRPHFRDADGQFAVRMQIVLINLNVARAVHGLEHVVLLVDLHRAEHVLLVKTPVAGGFPKVEPRHVRRDYELVIIFLEQNAQVFFDDAPRAFAPLGSQKIRPGPIVSGRMAKSPSRGPSSR